MQISERCIWGQFISQVHIVTLTIYFYDYLIIDEYIHMPVWADLLFFVLVAQIVQHLPYF